MRGDVADDTVFASLENSAQSGAPVARTGAGGEEESDKSGEGEDVEMVEDRFDREKPLINDERLVVSVCSLLEPE